MANQLFIVCPFSYMESFLQDKYGNDIFFLAFSGAVLQDQEWESLSQLKQLILKEGIKTIYIVNDTSCRFIDGIIKRNKTYGLSSENAIEELYIDNYFGVFKDHPLSYQKYKLAELNIKNQINTIVNAASLGSCISKLDVAVKGLLTSKEMKLYKEIQIKNNTIHEL